MYFMMLEIKETIKDFFGNVGLFFGTVFGGIGMILGGIFTGARYIIFKILCAFMAITSIGFIIGLFLLYKNVKECMNLDIAFTSTEFFPTMVVLLGLHFIVFVLSMIVRPKGM